MRLFVSYARVDKPYCKQIVKTLDVHEVWYDQRLHAGQKWWDEIIKHLDRSDGLVYLLSPDSVRSEYCQKEFVLARDAGKHIFPVLIQGRTALPDSLKAYQAIDLTEGLTTKAVKELLNAIYVAERDERAARRTRPTAGRLHAPVPVETPDPTVLINEVADALEAGDFDRAVFLLKRSKESGYESRFIDLQAILQEAEEALERQAYLREAEREYGPIVALVKHERTRRMGCQAFLAFRKDFPDFDPQNLLAHCQTNQKDTLEWCTVVAGSVKVQREGGGVDVPMIPAFHISKYPITNDQYQVFVDASDGYCDTRWWDFAAAAQEWRRDHPAALEVASGQGDYPRVNICWHEAMAYCRWLSAQTGLPITLPTEQQWQRAAQGNDERLYPWGSDFDPARCNTYESRIRHTTPVKQYPSGASPYGVVDMVGNAWEWCLNAQDGTLDLNSRAKRAVRGGSFISVQERSRVTSYFYLNALCRYDTIGFRVVRP